MKKYIHPKLSKVGIVLSDGSMYFEKKTILSKHVFEILDQDYLVHPSWSFTLSSHLNVRRLSSDQLERFQNKFRYKM
uniref:Ribosomal protein L31 n=1 Tax=Jakoba bahamiensis TaxID=221721 RepID=M4QDB7_9EUKA|nr:ribosomal protein L31 [Jakoba bahamiensis]AGH24170.1 ribosomal protein L31 [Jakoba bahamiensis]